MAIATRANNGASAMSVMSDTVRSITRFMASGRESGGPVKIVMTG